MNDVKEEVLPIFLYLSRNRKSPSNGPPRLRLRPRAGLRPEREAGPFLAGEAREGMVMFFSSFMRP